MNTTVVPELTLTQMLRRHAIETPDKVALRQKDFGIWHPYTWAVYFQNSSRFARGLMKMGLGEGGKVGVLSENRKEWVFAQMGSNLARAITIGVYPTSPAVEISHILINGDVEFIICEDQEQTDKVLEIAEPLPELRHIVVIDPKGLKYYDDPRIVMFDQVVALGIDDEKTNPDLINRLLDEQTLDDIAMVIYTSGSTGRPKGAMITYRSIRASVPGMVNGMGLNADDMALSYLPLCHVAEQIFSSYIPLYMGSLVNFGESLRTVQQDMREIAPSIFLGVPRIWEKMHSDILISIMETGGFRERLFNLAMRVCTPIAEKPQAERTFTDAIKRFVFYWLIFRAVLNFIGLRKVRVALSGAAPIPVEVLRFYQILGLPIRECYGATETTGMSTLQCDDDTTPGTVGVPLLGLEIKLGDQNEILIRGDQVFAGYYKNDEATRETIRDGWLHSGDVGVFEGDQLRIVDRLKDIMITAGGKNLSPSEIENTVKASPFIKECIAIGESRKYVTALIQIELESVSKWAEMENIAFTTFRTLAENEAVRILVQNEINNANTQLARVSQIRKFHLLVKELDHDDNEVTATMKIRRSIIQKAFSVEIESLY